MHSQHALVASQSTNFLHRFHQPLSLSGSCVPARISSTAVASSSSSALAPAAATFTSRLRTASKWDAYKSCQRQGLGFRVRKQHQLVRKICSQADTEADSIEDLNLEDLDDEQLDELFETYGEVVKAESEPRSTASELDDDAESLAFAVALAEVANEVKAGDIQVLCVKPLVYWTRFFVIATGFSRPQVDAIGKRMRDVAEVHYKRPSRGDLKPNAWTLLDFGDVVVHIFYPKERAYYNLEEFYGNAACVELPFESRSQM